VGLVVVVVAVARVSVWVVPAEEQSVAATDSARRLKSGSGVCGTSTQAGGAVVIAVDHLDQQFAKHYE
jgi:hypothetical protein